MYNGVLTCLIKSKNILSSVNLNYRTRFDFRFTMESYESNGRRLNAEYGGKKAQLVNVYTTQGELDPGRVLGKEKDVNPLSPTDIIPNAGAAHDIFWYFYPRSEAIDGIFEHLVDIVDAWL